MFSTFPKLADRNFVLSFLLPALLAFFAAAWAFPDVAAFRPLRSLTASDNQLSELAYLTFGVWLIAVLLMTANYTLFRLLEGYLPPVSWFVPLHSWHKRRFRALLSRHDTMMAEWEETLRQGQRFSQTKQKEISRLLQIRLSRYPNSEADVLPTSFGNVIRAFEVYSKQVYGADAIPVWMRLVSVIPKDYAAQIDAVRAEVDCFVNITSLAFILSVVSLGRVAASGLNVTHGMIVAIIAFSVSILSYYSAVSRAITWGEVVKSTFDCYLPTLVKQLGYAVPPTEAERKAFWEQFNARVLYRSPMSCEWPPVDKSDDKESSEPSPDTAKDGAANASDSS